MKKFFKHILISIAIVGCLASCQDQYTICELSKHVNVRGVFFTKAGNNFIETNVNSLSINLLNSPSFIYKDRKNISTFIFGLAPFFTIDSAKYVIKIDNILQADTVTIHYTSADVQLTKECGSIIAHNLIKVTTTNNTLDSVQIASPKIDNNIRVNLKLFF